MAKVAKAQKSANVPGLHVKIFSPYRTFFDGHALSVSAVNKTGPFDILPGHANFLTLLIPCQLLVRTPREALQFAIRQAVMHVHQDGATIFIDV